MDQESLKNIILDELLKLTPKESNVKKGFFAGSYLRDFKNRHGANSLVTEQYVQEFLKTGSRVFTTS